MVTSLLSLALNVTVPDTLAMTGEMTLTGKVLAIGGVKEKVIAAKRSKITHVLLPLDNKKDWEELESTLKEGLSVSYCSVYDDVWKAVTKKKKGDSVESKEESDTSSSSSDSDSEEEVEAEVEAEVEGSKVEDTKVEDPKVEDK